MAVRLRVFTVQQRESVYGGGLLGYSSHFRTQTAVHALPAARSSCPHVQLVVLPAGQRLTPHVPWDRGGEALYGLLPHLLVQLRLRRRLNGSFQAVCDHRLCLGWRCSHQPNPLARSRGWSVPPMVVISIAPCRGRLPPVVGCCFSTFYLFLSPGLWWRVAYPSLFLSVSLSLAPPPPLPVQSVPLALPSPFSH